MNLTLFQICCTTVKYGFILNRWWFFQKYLFLLVIYSIETLDQSYGYLLYSGTDEGAIPSESLIYFFYDVKQSLKF